MGEVFILWDRHQGISVGVLGYASGPWADEYKRYMVVEYASSATVEIMSAQYEAVRAGSIMHITLLHDDQKKKLHVPKEQVIVDKMKSLIMCESVFQDALRASGSTLLLARFLIVHIIILMLII